MADVTSAELERALAIAKRDMQSVGLYTRALDDVPVQLTDWGEAYAYFNASGVIEVPAFSWSRVVEQCDGRACTLEDVLRHELAHALADRHMEIVDTAQFASIFGAAYWDEWAEDVPFDPCLYVTEYATTAPCEDFAETVMVYARHQGRVSRFAARRGVMRAFRYLAWLARELDRQRTIVAMPAQRAVRARRSARVAAAFTPMISPASRP